MEKTEDVVFGELLASFEEVEFDGEGEARDLCSELFHELDGGLHGATGGEQVVYDDDALAGLDGVEVDFKRVGAVLEVVGDLCRGGRQLLRLADGNKACIEAVGHSWPEDEAAGLNAENEIDVFVDVVGGQSVDHLRKASLVLQERGDVVEEDAGFGEVGHGAYERLERLTVDGIGHGIILPGGVLAVRQSPCAGAFRSGYLLRTNARVTHPFVVA